MNESDFSKVVGSTFAETSAVIRRLKHVTHEVAHLNENGWRLGKRGELYWRLVVAVPVENVEVSDSKLAMAMLQAAREVLDDRIAALKPDDGVERLECPYDLRTKEGKAWKAERLAEAAT